jgi:choline dehydrogenase
MTGADVIIVGGGSAGCVLAARLSEDNARGVVLVEAGPDHEVDALRFLSRAIGWPYDWGSEVVSGTGRRFHYGRGRGVGGSSAINGAVALRPERIDVDGWPTGWQWNDLLPRLVALEHDVDFPDRPWHGASGPVPIVRWAESEWTPLQAGFVAGCEQVGFVRCPDQNEPDTTGVGPIPMNRDGSERVSARRSHLEAARGRPNLVIRPDSHVRRVIVRDGRAKGIELANGEVLHADTVILSAGVVQDPLLLWRSGIGPADRLGTLNDVALLETPVLFDLPAVGRHLTDHVVVTFAAEIDPRAAPEGAPVLQTILRATASGSDRHNDLQITPFARRHPDGRRSLAMSVALQLPAGEGFVEPSPEGFDGPPNISWPFTTDPANIARLRDGWRTAAAIAAASGLVTHGREIAEALGADDAEIDATILEMHSAFYHGVGTCRMGAGDQDHVVDTSCQVLGVEGLFVVDASVIPTVPRSNTNLAVTAMAEHFAAMHAGARAAVPAS